MAPLQPPLRIGKERFEIVKRLGAGCFGEVYLGKDTRDGKEVAMKFELRHTKKVQQLEHEAEVIAALRTPSPPQGVVELFHFGVEVRFNCLVMDLLGKSLEDHLRGCGGIFNVQTTVLIGDQVLQRIEYLHSKGFVHRDIKPENFMFGIGDKIHHVYMIDFGLSKMYWDSKRFSHIHMRTKLRLTGTARYASINTHKGIEQSRRDDLEAIGHMLLYFLRGSLPWSGQDGKTRIEKYKKITEKKEQTPIKDLCAELPPQLEEYMTYARNLRYADRPNYDKLFDLFYQCRESECKDHSFQWFEGKELPDTFTPLNPRTCICQPDDNIAKPTPRGCFCDQSPGSGSVCVVLSSLRDQWSSRRLPSSISR